MNEDNFYNSSSDVEEIEALKQEADSRYTLPTDFFIG